MQPDITPLGCAILELTVWWAERRRDGVTPTYEDTMGKAAAVAWRWLGWFRPGDAKALLQQAGRLCGRCAR